MTSEMTFDEYLETCWSEWSTYKTQIPSYRMGQHMFNVLYQENEHLADIVRGDLKLDPFHKDENIPAFERFVETLWNIRNLSKDDAWYARRYALGES